MITDNQTRKAIEKINEKLDRIEKIKQLPSTATLEDIVLVLNKITDNLKRR